MPPSSMEAALQAGGSAPAIDVFVIATSLLGGLALFLFGMDRMTESLRLVAGDRMRRILSRLTSNRLLGVLTGTGVTAVIQSSSITTVLVVGFVTSGLMTLAQAISVIMGANVGTTITAQVIALDVGRYALLVVAAGFLLSAVGRTVDARSWGTALLGIGLVFFGMTVMGDAMAPLSESAAFGRTMLALETPVLGILAGAAFTAVVQSSSATTGVVIVLAAGGLVSLEAGIAVILGANVGTSVTALLAAIGKPVEAVRAAIAHTLFNLAGVLLFLPFLAPLADVVGALGGRLPRQIANAHSIFNLSATVLFLGFTPQLAAAVTRLVPDRPAQHGIRPKYLDDALLQTPPLALERARLELIRMATRVRTMLTACLPAMLEGPRQALYEVEEMDDEVDALHGFIVAYLSRVGAGRLTDAQTEELVALMEATNNLEAMGDIIETNLVSLGRTRIETGVEVSRSTYRVLREFHAEVGRAFDMAMVALTHGDEEQAERVGEMKAHINELERRASAHQAERLTADAPKRVEAYRFEMDVITNLKRVYYFAKRTARVAVPAERRATS